MLDYVGDNLEADRRTGLQALLLDQFREVALVYAPNANAIESLVEKIISHCENQRFRFAVIDADSGKGNYNDLDPRSHNFDTKYAAFYYPWITISDPQTGQRRSIPPGGAILGIYARTDSERGVFKAPANEGGFGVLLTSNKHRRARTGHAEPARCQRDPAISRTRYPLSWARAHLSSDALWKHVPVRRLFIFLERSIYEGTQWVVFEPNDERLWERVKDTIRLFPYAGSIAPVH